jgi:hypothetical protein
MIDYTFIGGEIGWVIVIGIKGGVSANFFMLITLPPLFKLLGRELSAFGCSVVARYRLDSQKSKNLGILLSLLKESVPEDIVLFCGG